MIAVFIFLAVAAVFICANVLYNLALNPRFDKEQDLSEQRRESRRASGQHL